jgi:TRAP-type uncharacterized transport system substrate-binding protein
LRPALLLTAGLLIIATALIAAVYFWSPHANLRVTVGPPGSPAYRFVTAFAAVTEANHPRVRIKLVPVADLAASAKAIEDHTADLAIVRSDAVMPSNGATIAILRRDVVAFVVPAKTPIDKISGLAGKSIGIPQGPLQTYNEQTLDSILSYYDIPAKSVKRIFLPLAEIGAAVAEKRVAAVFAVGPMRPSTSSTPSRRRPKAPQAFSPSTRRRRSTSGFRASNRSMCRPELSGDVRPSPAIR